MPPSVEFLIVTWNSTVGWAQLADACLDTTLGGERWPL